MGLVERRRVGGSVASRRQMDTVASMTGTVFGRDTVHMEDMRHRGKTANKRHTGMVVGKCTGIAEDKRRTGIFEDRRHKEIAVGKKRTTVAVDKWRTEPETGRGRKGMAERRNWK